MSLLPSHHDQFRSKEYWDRFFLERGGEQFEWYGTYEEIKVHVGRTVLKKDRILIIGCGNSEISADFFDNGYQSITNIDFSPLVIEEMITKNTQRPAMKWHIGDMTCMPEYEDSAYDVVFDKGALDALMSEDTPAVIEKAGVMFAEISRLLSEKGKYICITLAESFIFKTLLAHFTALNWNITVETVQGKKPSPFKPFYVVISRHGSVGRTIDLMIDSLGNASVPRQVSPTAAMEEIPRIQEFNQKRFELGAVRVGRFELLDFMAPVILSLSLSVSGGKTGGEGEIPRFSVTLLDASYKAARSCVVFFVPPGRESEFQFSTQTGLQGIAEQAQCRRLLAVRCNRPHLFPQMKELQNELSPIANSLKPSDMSGDEAIPYMALEADGSWETLECGRSSISGEYIVEEEPDESRPNGVTRRLVFLQNQNFIQTEVKLVEKRDSTSSKSRNTKSTGSSKGKSKSKVSKKSKSNKDDKKGERDWERDEDGEEETDCCSGLELDYTYLDDHHKAVLSAMVLSPDIISGGSKIQHKPSPSSSSSSSSLNTAGSSSDKNTPRVPYGLIIGLGGGAMPMCMQRYLPGMRLATCEMDGEMLGIAVKFFAFKCNARNSVIVSEGLALLRRLEARIDINGRGHKPELPADDTAKTIEEEIEGKKKGESSVDAEPSDALDFLFIDADSKDSSLGLSAPPKAFITPCALRTLYRVLRPGGILAINVVARTSSLLEQLVLDTKTAFADGEAEEEKQVLRAISGNLSTNSSVLGSDSMSSGAVSVSGKREQCAGQRSQVHLLKVSELTANTTLLVVKGTIGRACTEKEKEKNRVDSVKTNGTKKKPSSHSDFSPSASTSPSASSLKSAREDAIEEWLKVIGLSSDPLELVDTISKLKEV